MLKLSAQLIAIVMSEDLIDNAGSKEHSADISYKNGMSFSGMTRFFGVALLIVGFSALVSGSIAGFVIGLVLIGGGGFICTSSYGTDISTSTNHAREYHQIFYIKTGKWKTIAPYSDLCVIKIGKTAKRTDLTGANSTGLDKSKNEVYLMTYDHRKRFLVKVCNTVREANEESEFLADALDKKVAAFNPKISEATQARLRQRR